MDVHQANRELAKLGKPSEYFLSHQVHPPVLRPQVNLALQPGVWADDQAGAVLGAVGRALTVVC